MIKNIEFNNYKIFNSEQNFQIKPLTVLIGKNSSGKSAIAKLPTLISASLEGKSKDPFTWENNGVILGSSILDINYNKDTTGEFCFKITNNLDKFLKICNLPLVKNT